MHGLLRRTHAALKPGGTYAFEEIEAWLLAAGFTETRTLEAPAPAPLILAVRGH